MNWQQRIDNYVKETGYPRSLFIAEDGRVVGTWIFGQNYTVKSKFYGGYPHGYLKRVKALFPDKNRVLHLFSGKVDTSIIPGDTVDINPELKPTFLDDAQTLEKVPLKDYDLVMADPPYSIEDCERYSVSMVKRTVVMRTLGERLKKGATVVWLDQVLPQWRKTNLSLEGLIGCCKSTNHRFRIITIFKKL